MTKKKKKREGDNARQGGGQPESPGQPELPELSDGPHSLPDRRMIEGLSRQLAAQSGGASQQDSADEAAQQIIYRAFESRSDSQRVALAHQALQLSPDCADAYVLLAEHAETLSEALDLYGQGVAAGERQLGKRDVRELQGHYWLVLETRPYMRAVEGLASCLWSAGRRDEAVARYRDLLLINPDDHQGIRYLLASALLESECHDDLERLLASFPNDVAAEWSYCRALLAFRKEGDCDRSRGLLREAAEQNSIIPRYVTGAIPLPRPIPDQFDVGSEDEAVCYAAHYLPAWKDTPGATVWMRTTLSVALPEPPRHKRPVWGKLKKVLATLHQDPDDVWEVDLRAVEPATEEGRTGDKFWAFVITSASQRGVLVLELLSDRPKDRDVWDDLLNAMRHPEDRDPQRPAEIRVSRKTWFNSWKSKLEQIGVQCRLSDNLKHVDYTLEETMPPLEMLGRLGRGADPSDDWPAIETLPQLVGEIWQADVRRLPGWIEVEGKLRRPWLYLVVDVETEMILATEVSETDPPRDWLWHGVRQAMCFPAVGTPHRPGVIQVVSDEQRTLLAENLESCDVRCVTSDTGEPVRQLVDELADHLVGPRQMSALISAPNMTLEQVGSFFAAAAQFYQARPWREVPADSVIRVCCDQFSSGPWYVVVMGQSGLELGLALYEDAKVLRTILMGDLSDEETGRRTTGLSITYGEEYEIAPQDVDAAEECGWDVAGPEAFPSAMRINPGVSFRAPLNWELRLLECCLRAVPPFVADDQDRQTIDVATEAETFTLELQWMDDLGEDEDADA